MLAPDVHLITGFPQHAINCYLLGDVLVDAMTRRDGPRILRALEGHVVRAHAVTHAHPDHQGASKAVCDGRNVPMWAPAGDADAIEDPSLIAQRQPQNPLAQFFDRTMTGPPVSVDRKLVAGDEVGGFRVIDAPGHSKGHVVLFRENDRVLVVGDVLCNVHTITRQKGLRTPMDLLTPDPERNRESAKALGDLEPELVLFGHGAPYRDAAAFKRFCAAL
jgi:hydroxyacylglutathione hydrolase